MELLSKYPKMFSFLLKLIIIILFYFLLRFLLKRFGANISDEKIGGLVVLLIVLYYILSGLLGFSFDINI